MKTAAAMGFFLIALFIAGFAIGHKIGHTAGQIESMKQCSQDLAELERMAIETEAAFKELFATSMCFSPEELANVCAEIAYRSEIHREEMHHAR